MIKKHEQLLPKVLLSTLPTGPGVYRFLDPSGRPIYVGKAKNLRRRLGQYRNARRVRAHQKMRKIVQEAHRLTFEECASELDALLKEAELIRSIRPRFNLAGAFSFLYPYVGIQAERGVLQLFITHRPDCFPEAQIYGCFRSQSSTRNAVKALAELLSCLATRVPPMSLSGRSVLGVNNARLRPDPLFAFRGVQPTWSERLSRFFKDAERAPLSDLILELSDRPAARKHAKEIQRSLNLLEHFRRHEALRLMRALQRSPQTPYPVPQDLRDPLLLWTRLAPQNSTSPI